MKPREHYYITLLTPAIIFNILAVELIGGWENFIFAPVSLLYTTITGLVFAKKLADKNASNSKILLTALAIFIPILIARFLVPTSSDY